MLSDCSQDYGRHMELVKSVTEKNGVMGKRHIENRRGVECSGYFALRSNAVSDALKLYPSTVSETWWSKIYQLKNWLDGDVCV